MESLVEARKADEERPAEAPGARPAGPAGGATRAGAGGLVEVRGLKVDFLVKRRRVRVLAGVTLSLLKGEVLAVVGETGCGKSVTGSAILRLLPENAQASGSVRFEGKELLGLSERAFRKLRGSEVMSVPQNPVGSLDPLMRVGPQVAECLTRRGERPPASRRQARQEVLKTFADLGLPDDERFWGSYPCELSGGMCQRVLVAMGVVSRPKLLVVDEPTKAVDWPLRKSVADLLERLNKDKGCTLLLVTHDIPLARRIADRVAVMYAGEIVEVGAAQEVLDRPAHPYARGLVDSSPAGGFQLMDGRPPSFEDLPEGCRFAGRCPYRKERCDLAPPMAGLRDGRSCRCWRPLFPTEAKHA